MRSSLQRVAVVGLMVVAFMAAGVLSVPLKINFQGRLTDSSGDPVTGMHQISFALYSAPTGGAPLWQETHPSVAVDGGLFLVAWGETTPLTPSMFDTEPLWLGIAVDADPEMTPREELVSVPYALRTATLDGATGGVVDGDLAVINGNVVIGSIIAPASTRLYLLHDQDRVTCWGNSLAPALSRTWCWGVRSSDGALTLSSADDLIQTELVQLTLTSVGLLGVGTDNPRSVLDVYGDLTVGPPDATDIRLQRGSETGRLVLAGGPPVDNDDAEIVFCGGSHAVSPGAVICYSGALETMRLTQSGELGLGVSVPTARLHLGGTAGVDGIRFPDGTLQTTAFASSSSGGWQDDGLVVRLSDLGDRLAVGDVDADGRLDVVAVSPANPILVLYGAPLQSASLLECRRSDNTPVLTVDPAGGVRSLGYVECEASLVVRSSAVSDVTFVCEPMSGQTADVLECRDTGGFPRLRVSSSGAVTCDGYTECRSSLRVFSSDDGTVTMRCDPTPSQTADVLDCRRTDGSISLALSSSGALTCDGYTECRRSLRVFSDDDASITLRCDPTPTQTASVFDCRRTDGSPSLVVSASGNLDCTGTVSFADDLSVAGDLDCDGLASFSNTVTFDGSTCQWSAGTACDFSDVVVCGSSLEVQGGLDVTAGDLTLSSGGTLTLSGASDLSLTAGDLTVTSGTLQCTGTSVTLDGTSSLQVGADATVVGELTVGTAPGDLHRFTGTVEVMGGLQVIGPKSAVVETSLGKTLVYAQESPENWFEDFGGGQLKNGCAHIELDPLFLETVSINEDNPMKVFIQPNDDFSAYVKRSETGFEVIQNGGKKGNGQFTYRVVAKRRGFENDRLEAAQPQLSQR